MNTQEIECRFLEIDKEVLLERLRRLGAEDRGEILLEETIFYDPEFKWRDEQKYLRVRKCAGKTTLTYKEHREHTATGTYEVEFEVSDAPKAEVLFESIGLQLFRHQAKKRHTFKLDDVTFDIDTWPRIPTYVELEGSSEEKLKEAAQAVGLVWEDADFHNARWVIENKYKIPVGEMKWFTFERFE